MSRTEPVHCHCQTRVEYLVSHGLQKLCHTIVKPHPLLLNRYFVLVFRVILVQLGHLRLKGLVVGQHNVQVNETVGPPLVIDELGVVETSEGASKCVLHISLRAVDHLNPKFKL